MWEFIGMILEFLAIFAGEETYKKIKKKVEKYRKAGLVVLI